MSSVLLLGESNAFASRGAKLWRFGVGSHDDGLPINVLCESNWIPVEGGQEHIFCTAYLTVTWSMAVQLRLTPIVDQSAANPEVVGDYTFVVDQPLVNLPGPSTRRTQTFEFQLIVRTLLDDVEVSRNQCRGARLRLLLESLNPGLDDDYLAIDAFRVEVEPVQEQITSEAST